MFDNDPLLCEIVLEHWNVEEVTTKRNKSENQDVRIGFTSFKSIKPFYVRPCKSGDIDTCQCRVHVNFHNAVDALLKMLRTSGMHFYFGSNERIDGVECYSSFMKFLYKDCSCGEHGLLESNCESGDCSHWSKNWSNISTTITTDIVNASQNRNNAATNKALLSWNILHIMCKGVCKTI